jgi:hypothetical protein
MIGKVASRYIHVNRFGKSQRDSLSKAKNAPGPGHYELTSGFGNEVPKYR